MDLEISPFTILVPLFIFILFLLISKQRNRTPSNNLPPGPRKLPFIGNLHLFFGSQPPHRTLNNLSKKYGPLMHLQLGEIPTLVVSSPEIAKLFLKTHDITFASRPSFLATELILGKGNTDIVFAPYGEYWRQLRKICTLELLSMKRVNSFRPIRENEFTSLCRWIASQSGSVINLSENVLFTNYDIVTLATLGKKTNDQAKFTYIAKEIISVMSGFNTAELFPSLKLFGKMSGMRKKIEGLLRESDMIILKIIDEHKLKNSASEGEKQGDLLDVLLKLQEEGLELPLTTKDIINRDKSDVLGAGVETSSLTIDWAMSQLLKNPSVLKKAQGEVRQVFDRKTRVDESYFDELKYLKSVIKETFRVHPSSALLLPRECREECKINGYDITQKTHLLVNTWAIHRDPKHWKDPERFEPERFLDNNVDYKGNDFQFIPFGAGRRICPGMSFGLANVELLLAMLLYHFDWILPGGMKPEELDMAEVFGASLKRKSDLNVIPILRRPLPIE